jgi:magnesium transporter
MPQLTRGDQPLTSAGDSIGRSVSAANHVSDDDKKDSDVKRSHKRQKKLFRHRTPPGSTPGLLVDDDSAHATTIHAFAWSRDQLTEQDLDDTSGLKSMKNHDGVLWVDIDGVGSTSVVRSVGEIFGLHPLSLEDVIHVHQRSKVEEYEHYYYVVARMVTPGETFQTEQVSLFLGDDWVVTFQSVPGDCLGDVRNHIRDAGSQLRAFGADFLAYRIIDAIVDGYFPLLEKYDGRLSTIEDEIENGNAEAAMAELHVIRRELRDIKRALWPQREAVGSLLRGGIQRIRPETSVFFRDCADHTAQLLDVVDSLRETCNELRDLHMSHLSQKTNDVTNRLSTIATLFLPITFVAGLYGMNFDPEVSDWNMPEVKWAFGYPFALGLMLVLEIVLVLFLVRRRN